MRIACSRNAAALLFLILAGAWMPGPAALAGGDAGIRISLSLVSPCPVAGEDVRLQVALSWEQNGAFAPAMLDASCFHIDCGDGNVIVPRKEKLGSAPVELGDSVSVARTVNVGPLLKVDGCRTVKAWWEFKDLSSEKITFAVFEWPLDRIEAVIETELGTMTAEVFPDKAPLTAANFVRLAMEGFYDGLTFHRVIPGFMIQGGCPNGDGTGGPGYTIPGEFNDLSHMRGVLSMARGESPDSAGSQFFIIHENSPALDWNYAAFGQLVAGFETLDAVAAVETEANPYNAEEQSRPLHPPKIIKVTVRLKAPPSDAEHRKG